MGLLQLQEELRNTNDNPDTSYQRCLLAKPKPAAFNQPNGKGPSISSKRERVSD